MDTQEWLDLARSRLLHISRKPDLVMVKGEGMWLYDNEGEVYLDFVGGWAVNCLGHSPRVLVEALSRQAQTLINASPSFHNAPMLEYADLLLEHSELQRVFFTSTGAEANEGAIKLARKYGLKSRNGATDIITTQRSFHGRTFVTMAATGKPQWERPFGTTVAGFKKARFNDLDSVAALLDEQTCAIMLEPVQGEGGVNIAGREFLQGLRDLCDQRGVLLIFDEVQTGMGRTGRLFCYEHYGVVPDILTLGKGIGGGYPLSALLAREFLNIFEPGEQGGTYTGQPLGMAAGLAVLRTLLQPGFLQHCRRMGIFIQQQLQILAAQLEIDNIRGMGLLIAFDLQHSRGADVVQACLEEGLLINAPQEKTIRLMPPLIVEEEHIRQMLSILGRHLARREA